MSQPRALNAGVSGTPNEIVGRLFIIVCSLGIAIGVVATAGMLLAASAFATVSTFVVPLVATFEGFRDAGGTNAVTVTGSWTMTGVVTIIGTFLLSFFLLRGSGSSADNNTIVDH